MMRNLLQAAAGRWLTLWIAGTGPAPGFYR